MFVQTAHAASIQKAEQSLQESQQETSKIESNLKTVQTEKQQLTTAVSEKDAKITQLEQENSALKD